MYYNVPPEPPQQPGVKHTPRQAAGVAFRQAEELVRAGHSLKDVESELMRAGFDAELVRSVLFELSQPASSQHRRRGQKTGSSFSELDDEAALALVHEAQIAANKEAGRKHMLYGGLWFAGGLLVTLFTLAAAQSGGTYVIAYGAILTGAVQFLYGANQASKR